MLMQEIAGVYDSTFNYTTIQIGVHEINSQMTLESFADVPINEIMRSTFSQMK